MANIAVMIHLRYLPALVLITIICLTCEKEEASDFSGVYCLNFQNMEMTVFQSGDQVTFSIDFDQLDKGAGSVRGDTLMLTANVAGGGAFEAEIIFTSDRKSFTGPFVIRDGQSQGIAEGILQGSRGGCVIYNVEENGVPRFISSDFTQPAKIEKVSKFRSGFGHSFTDGTETCRSMKHYMTPLIQYRENRNVEIYSPVKGTIISMMHDAEGGPSGLYNVEIQIRPDSHPAFTIHIFHCDLVSADVVIGKRVLPGELIGYARMYYENENQYVTSFDIALWANTPSGMRLIPYFEAMTDAAFDPYADGGTLIRQDFVISKEAREVDPLECNGESFLKSGNIENWVVIN